MVDVVDGSEQWNMQFPVSEERVIQLHHCRALLVSFPLCVVPVLTASSADTVFAPFFVGIMCEVVMPLLFLTQCYWQLPLGIPATSSSKLKIRCPLTCCTCCTAIKIQEWDEVETCPLYQAKPSLSPPMCCRCFHWRSTKAKVPSSLYEA
eukprot:2283824-Amphidinium_carterae.1